MAVDSSAIPESLLESELFGDRRGAFTGALQGKSGIIESANAGTLFLDEVSNLSLQVQAKLLRFIQERSYRRVGEVRERTVDVRMVSATNRALRRLVDEGEFLEDLYYRLSVITIEIPSLKERRENIPPLVYHFIRKFNAASSYRVEDVRRDAMDILVDHPWPGSVRQLENAIEWAVILRKAGLIQPADLPEEVAAARHELDPSGRSLEELERPTSQPVYPFCNRGVLLWGEVIDGRVTCNLGAHTGAGIDVDASRCDIDDHKDAILRLFAQPFRESAGALGGLSVVGQGTYGSGSVPTNRFELAGLESADYESSVWRWRTEQTIGSALGDSDRVTAEIGSRRRLAAELLYAHGPLAASLEWLDVSYADVVLYHDYWTGSRRLMHDQLSTCDGGVRSISAWLSVMLTGEGKKVDDSGWTQPDPERPFVPGEGGSGAWELRARLSTTETDEQLFATQRIYGYTAEQLPEGSMAVGEGGSVSSSDLQGATIVHEATLGVGWSVNRNLRFQLDATTLWAPDFAEGVDGIVSGGNSNLADVQRKNAVVEREHSLGLRCIFRV